MVYYIILLLGVLYMIWRYHSTQSTKEAKLNSYKKVQACNAKIPLVNNIHKKVLPKADSDQCYECQTYNAACSLEGDCPSNSYEQRTNNVMERVCDCRHRNFELCDFQSDDYFSRAYL